MDIKIINIDELKFADYNPRNITEKQFEDLKTSIEKFGFIQPVIVNSNPERLNTIVGGHQRVRVAKKMGYKEVPIVYKSLSLEEEKELNIRLNKNVGNWDWEKLGNEFDMEDLLSWGFSEGEMGLGKSDGKEEIDTDNLSNSLDSYLEGTIKQIVLFFNNEEYAKIVEWLEKMMKEFGVNSHTEVFLKLKDFYETNRTQE